MNLRQCSLLPLAAWVFATCPASAAPVTYHLVDWGNYSPPQSHLQGTITIDDADANFLIEPAEVLTWSFTGTVGSGDPFSLAHGPGAQLQCEPGGCFLLDGPDLALHLQTQGPTRFADASGLTRFDVSGDKGLYGDAVAGDRIAAMRWFNGLGAGYTSRSVLDNPPLMRFATAVPEPSAALLALAGLAGLAVLAGARQFTTKPAATFRPGRPASGR